MRGEATKGASATLLRSYTIGRYALIGSGTVVVKDVLDYVIVAGKSAKVIGYIGQCDVLLEFDGCIAKCNLCGLSLRDDGGDVSSL